MTSFRVLHYSNTLMANLLLLSSILIIGILIQMLEADSYNYNIM